jgi:hypothetical protein
MVWDQVSMVGVAKRWPVVLPAPHGQAHSDVQGHCHVATASSSGAKAQDTDELNCIDSEGSPCSSACLQSLLSRWIPDESKNSSSIALPLTCPVAVSSFLAMMVISSCFSCYDPVENCPIFVSTMSHVTASAHAVVTLVLCQYPWSTVLGNTRHVQVIRQNSVESTIANPCCCCCCCCDFIYCLESVGTHQRFNLLDPVFSSNHSCRPVCSSSSKLSLLCVNNICHLNTALQPTAVHCTLVWSTEMFR